ncbi:hypothetical protein R3P38DRAFT_3206533 [Favolaschia claudopus]|uniref:Uncharacterized protein n=1 Tax=Favolaschia claudopus TaxID=2862362 RepID=A0AAW0AM26_9AGAR
MHEIHLHVHLDLICRPLSASPCVLLVWLARITIQAYPAHARACLPRTPPKPHVLFVDSGNAVQSPTYSSSFPLGVTQISQSADIYRPRKLSKPGPSSPEAANKAVFLARRGCPSSSSFAAPASLWIQIIRLVHALHILPQSRPLIVITDAVRNDFIYTQRHLVPILFVDSRYGALGIVEGTDIPHGACPISFPYEEELKDVEVPADRDPAEAPFVVVDCRNELQPPTYSSSLPCRVSQKAQSEDVYPHRKLPEPGRTYAQEAILCTAPPLPTLYPRLRNCVIPFSTGHPSSCSS